MIKKTIGMILTTCALTGWCGAVSCIESLSQTDVQAIWPQGLETTMNTRIGFHTAFSLKRGEPERAELHMVAWYSYRITLNGQFVGFGPARGPKGMFRPDNWKLADFAREGRNELLVEVAGYNVPNFYLMEQPPFFKGKVVVGDRVLAKTKAAGGDFTATRMPIVEKAPRYTYQRTFAECYRLPGPANPPALPLAPAPEPTLIERRVPYPLFELNPHMTPVSFSDVRVDTNAKLHTDRSLTFMDDKNGHHKGYSIKDLEVNSNYLAQQLVFENRRAATEAEKDADAFPLPAGKAAVFDNGLNDAGFPGLRVEVKTPGRLTLNFDEVLNERGEARGILRYRDCCNIIVWDFTAPGVYEVDAFEPYMMRYVELAAISGDFTISAPRFRSYKNSTARAATFHASDPALDAIFSAARETFRQNAVDIFMDCAGRERAGWNCDAFFTGPVATLLTGNADLERAFEETYALPPKFENLPDGMLPMCYPSDHRNGSFIPNWAMWFVLETEEYFRRTGDRAIIEKFKPRFEKLIGYLWTFRNADGLLERLPSWIFVEWSRCNRLVRDVNYPSNMTWADTLEALDRLYGRPDWAAEAKRVRETIRKQSWTGEWFCDNAVRQKDGTLKLSGECTETCQYYAFFHRVATPESHPALWKTMLTDFGPQRYDPKDRKKLLKHEKIWPSNAFIGNYLRLKLLERAGLGAQILRETKGYFTYMAERTGTLWENDTTCASCSHGFASYAAVLLVHSILGAEVDLPHRVLRLKEPDVTDLDFCEATLPVGNDKLFVRWSRRNGKIVYTPRVPDGWKVETDAAQLVVPAADWSLRVNDGTASAHVAIEPLEDVQVKGEKMQLARTYDPNGTAWKRPVTYAGWTRGQRPKGLAAYECSVRYALRPESMRIRLTDGTVLTRDTDYVLEPEWGAIARVEGGRIASNATVLVDYAYGPQRIDRIVTKDGQIKVRKGVPRSFLPEIPPLEADEEPLANVYLDARTTKLTDRNVLPVLENDYREPLVYGEAARLVPKTWAKLMRGEKVTVLAWGDSVTDGGYLPPADRWHAQFVRRLRARFPKAQITLKVQGWGGRSSGSYLHADLVEGPNGPHDFTKCVVNTEADLVVSEFVNDAGFTAEHTRKTYGQIRDALRAVGKEWIILTPHYTRPDWMGISSLNVCEDDPRIYVKAVRTFARENKIALADASVRWGRLWRRGIPYTTLFTNEINHPNAFGCALYADALMDFFGGDCVQIEAPWKGNAKAHPLLIEKLPGAGRRVLWNGLAADGRPCIFQARAHGESINDGPWEMPFPLVMGHSGRLEFRVGKGKGAVHTLRVTSDDGTTREFPISSTWQGLARVDWDPFGPEWQRQWTPDVEKAIDDRIEKLRKADARVTDLPPETSVSVDQISSEFLFGANMFNFDQLGTTEGCAAYRAVFTNLLNAATIPFYWGGLEPEKGKPRYQAGQRDQPAFWNAFDFEKDDPYQHVEWRRPSPEKLIAFCQQHHIATHGHTMIYVAFHPKWVYDEATTPAKAQQLFDRHVAELAQRYGDSIDQWDVVNESMNRESTKGNPNDASNWYQQPHPEVVIPHDMTRRAFEVAAQNLPARVRLSINDAWTMKNNAYGAFTRKLIRQGAKIDVIGYQKHIFKPKDLLTVASGYPCITNYQSWDIPGETARLAELATFGLPIHISEITISSPRGLNNLTDAAADAIQARMTRAFYRLWFSWPNVDRITYWNLVDGLGAKNERMSSGWFNRDMSPKAVAVEMDRLINHEWRTHLTTKTDKDGTLAFRGFKGRYRLTWRENDGPHSREITLR